jgi:anti-sigma regulatory factor (Ser/Thr protein kinase)
MPPLVPPVPLTFRFAAHPASVRLARRAVVRALPAGVGDGVRGDLELIASELVTNACRYGARSPESRVEVTLWPADGHYWVAVSDPGEEGPCRRLPEGEGGRGLLLVDSLAAAWAVRERAVRGFSVVAGLAFERERAE